MSAHLRIVGEPRPGEALRVVVLGNVKSIVSGNNATTTTTTNNNKAAVLSNQIEMDRRNSKQELLESEFYLEFRWMRSSVVGQNKGRKRDENAIEGANGPIYIVNRDDVGFKIFAEVRVFHVRSEGNPSKGGGNGGGGRLLVATLRSEANDDKTVLGAQTNKTKLGDILRNRKEKLNESVENGSGNDKFSQNEKTKSDESSKTSTFSTETKAEKLLGEIQITKDDFLEEDVDLNDNDDEMIYTSVLRKLKAYARLRLRQMNHFANILHFFLFFSLYCTMLYHQTMPIESYDVQSSITEILHPKVESTQDTSYVYDWLSQDVVNHIWTDSVCGDSVCQRPYEFPSYGRFGCKADCGVATNVIRLLLHIQTKFDNSQAISSLELMSQAKWNMCLKDPGRTANDLPDLCWYEKDQDFNEVNTNKIVNFDVINGNWYVHIKGDYLGLVQGKIYRVEESGELSLTPTAPLWSTCTKKSLFKNARSRLSSMSKNDNALPERRKMYSSHNQTRNETRRPNNYDYGIPPSYNYPQYGYPPYDVSQYMYPPYDVSQYGNPPSNDYESPPDGNYDYGTPPYDVPQYGYPPYDDQQYMYPPGQACG